jgi:hypothetical protein
MSHPRMQAPGQTIVIQTDHSEGTGLHWLFNYTYPCKYAHLELAITSSLDVE